MRKIRISALLLLLCTVALGLKAEEQNALFVNLTNGQKLQFLLPDQQPQIDCYRGQMWVAYLDADHREAAMNFDRDEVASLTLGTADVSGIAEAAAGESRVRFDMTHAGVVSISGLLQTDRVQVFTLDGKSIGGVAAQPDGTASVDVSRLGKGVYLISVNKRFTFKLMKP